MQNKKKTYLYSDLSWLWAFKNALSASRMHLKIIFSRNVIYGMAGDILNDFKWYMCIYVDMRE